MESPANDPTERPGMAPRPPHGSEPGPAQAEAQHLRRELARTADKYQALFHTMNQGFCVIKILLDASGQRAVDWRYLELNPVFAQQAGLPADAQGKTIREMLPGIEPFWLDFYGQVALTGEAMRAENEVPPLGRWYDVQAFRLGDPEACEVAVLFTDITARKRREANLGFLAEVSQDLAQLTSTTETMALLGRKIGAYFRVPRVHLAVINEAAGTAVVTHEWHTDGLADLADGRVHRLDDFVTREFQRACRAQETIVVHDTRTDARTDDAAYAPNDIRAFVTAPFVRDAQWLALLSISDAAPREWSADDGQLLGELTAHIWMRLERARAEEALAASEAKYRSLFDSIDEGFVISELLYDEHGRPIDALMLETNASYARITRTTGAAGRRAREIFPEAESTWFEAYARVLKTGEGVRFESYFAPLDSWIEMFVARVGGAGSHRFASVFNDVTARKRHENHAAFLDGLSQALAVLDGPDEIVRATGEHLSAYLGVSFLNVCDVELAAGAELAEARVTVVAAWERAGLPSPRGTYRAGDYLSPEFLRAARAGEAIVIHDTDTDPRVDAAAYRAIGMRAFVAVPILNDGAWPGLISALVPNPRNWRADEADLLVEVGNRVFPRIERARAVAAVRASEAKYRTLFDSIDEGFCTVEVLFDAQGQATDYRFLEANPAFERQTGLVGAVGRTMRELAPTHEPYWFDLYGRVARTGEPVRVEHEAAALGRFYDVYAFRIGSPAAHRVAILFQNVMARKQAEEALRVSEAKYRTLFETMDQGFGIAELLPGAGPNGTVDFRWLEINPQVERLTGMPQAALLAGRSMRNVMPQLEDILYEQYEQVARTGEPMRFEQYAQVLNRWFDVYVYALDGPASHRIALLFSNITARKQAEEALRLAEEQHRAELEQRVAQRTQQLQESRDLLHGIAEAQTAYVTAFKSIRDAGGRIVDLEFIFANSVAEQTGGGRPLLGGRYLDLFPAAENSGLLDLFRRVIESGAGEEQEVYYDDGRFSGWFRSSATRLGDGVLSIGEDITARKQAEQERARSLRLLEQAEAVAGLGSWDYDLATGVLQWSDGMYHLFGLPPGQPVQPGIYLAHVLAEDRPRAERLVRQFAAGTGGAEETLRLRVADQVKSVRIRAVVLHDEAGRPTRVLGVDLDISQLQRLEADNLRLRLGQQQVLFEAVQAAQEAERKRMAESLHNGIGQMLYATKLRIDQLHAPLLGTNPALVAARTEADRLLAEAIRQTRALSHELVPMMLEEFGLAKALQDVANKMSTPLLRLRSYVLLDDDATPLSPTLQLALYRMAQELAQNIVKHARGATTAALELETMPGWVLLRAEDNGPGFAPAAAAAGRPGLGLRSIRDRVALLGGQVETGAAATGGAFVRIRIPWPVFFAA